MGQLRKYLEYERMLKPQNRAVAILAATNTDDVIVWQDGADGTPTSIDDAHVDVQEKFIRPIDDSRKACKRVEEHIYCGSFDII